MTRRDVLGASIATLVLGGFPASGAPARSGAAGRLANQGSILECSGRDAAASALTSLRSSASRFEWLQPGRSLLPVFQYSGTASPLWQARAASAAADGMVLSAAAPGLEARVEIGAYGDTGAFRWHQSYSNVGSAPLAGVSRVSALDLDLRKDIGRLVVHCVRRDGDYTREALPLQSKVTVRGGDWNAPSHTGLIIVEAVEHAEFLVLGVQRERGWSFELEQLADRLRMSVTLTDLQRTLEAHDALAACPLFLGACGGDLDAAVNLALHHLRARILPPALDHAPWVSYNIWSTDAKDVEKNILDEIPFAAAMGIELFYLDASWYRGSSTRGNGDWGKGIGVYVEDRSKFPQGLRHLSDQVHAAGMKFGLWVGPNIVDAALVPGQIPSSWLATVDGRPAELKIPSWENTCLQVCLGASGYVEHLKENLARLVEDYRLDWIKWDNSGIPALPARCNRGDHGHAPGDGSDAALLGQYAVFEHLHRKFPDLALEQCGYGSRLDYGLAPSIRANWCSDTCYPASRLRSNSLACASVYPSAYNAAWIVNEDTELFGAKTTAIIDAAIRSRMVGLFGVGTLNGQMSQRASLYPQAIRDRLSPNVALYKKFRHLLYEQVSFPYPPYGTDPRGWQAVQFTDPRATQGVLLAFRASSTQPVSEPRLSRLDPHKSYRLRFTDGGTESIKSGRELMEAGVYLSLPEPGASEIVLIDEA
jgi:hypothetical protein